MVASMAAVSVVGKVVAKVASMVELLVYLSVDC